MDKLRIKATSHKTTSQQFQQIYTELPIPKEVKIEYGKNIWRKKKDKKRINYELLPADLIKIPEKITNITGSKYAVTQKKHTSYRCVSFYRGLNAINNIEDKKIGETRNIGRFQMFHEKSDQKWPYQSHKIVRKRKYLAKFVKQQILFKHSKFDQGTIFFNREKGPNEKFKII